QHEAGSDHADEAGARVVHHRGRPHDDPVPDRATGGSGFHCGEHRHEVPRSVDGGADGGGVVKIEVAFTPAELAGIDLGDRVVVVLDVLRATSTIVEALANGARAVSPVSTVDEAVRLAEALGREGVLLAGERRSLRIDGFDMGNSPLEFTRERVSGKQIVLTTTNGTVAILASATARRVLIASYLNLGAVAEELVHDGGPASIVCSGRER